MNLFQRIKRIFFKEKCQTLPETAIDGTKILLAIQKEHDQEKILQILYNYCPDLLSSEIVQIISKLQIGYRVQGIEIAQKYLTPYDLFDLALNKLDYKGKLEILEKFQYKLDLEDLFQLFNNLPPDQRMLALEKTVDRFDSYSLAEIIKKYIPLYERLDCLNRYHDRLDSFSKAAIIENLDTERKINALNQYGDELNKTDLNDIVCSTESSKIVSVLNIVYNNLSAQQIADIIQYYIPEKQKLEALYKYCYKLNSSTISDLIKFAIPEEQKEEAMVSLQNRLQSSNLGEVIQFCKKSKEVLEKVQQNLDPEDIEYFKNQKETL